MELIITTDKDRRAVQFFQANLGADFWEKHKEPFKAWLNGRKPYPGNFARYVGLRIPDEVLNPPELS